MAVSLVADLGMEFLPELQTATMFSLCGMLSYVLFNYGLSVLVRVKTGKEIIADDNVEKYTRSTEDFGEESSHDEDPSDESACIQPDVSMFEEAVELLWKEQYQAYQGQEEDDSEWSEWISRQQETISELREQEEAQEQEQKRRFLDDVETRIRRWMEKPFILNEQEEAEEEEEQEQKRCFLDDVETRIRRWMEKPFTLNKPPRQPLHQQEESDGQETDPFDEPWESDEEEAEEEEDRKDAFHEFADSEQPVEARQPRRIDWFEATFQEDEDEAPWLARQRSNCAPGSNVSTPVASAKPCVPAKRVNPAIREMTQCCSNALREPAEAAHCRSDPNPEEAGPSSGWTTKDALPSVDEERWRHTWSPAMWGPHKWEWRQEKGKPAAGSGSIDAPAACGKPSREWQLEEEDSAASTSEDSEPDDAPAAFEKPKWEWRKMEDKSGTGVPEKPELADAWGLSFDMFAQAQPQKYPKQAAMMNAAWDDKWNVAWEGRAQRP